MRENKKPNPPKTAEGLATKEPEQSPPLPPGPPSGVVEALKALEGCSALLFIQIGQLCLFKERMESIGESNELGTMLGTVNFMLKEARSQFKEINPVIAKLRALPQAPATPASAPVEVRYEHLAHDDEMWASDEVEYEPGKWEMVGAKWMGEKYKDGMKRVRRKVPAPGSQGVEAKVPSCPHCKQPMTEYPASTFGRWWCDNFTSCEGKKARAK